MSIPNFEYQVQWSDFTTRDSRPRGETEDAHIHVSFNTNYGIPNNDGEYSTDNVVLTIVMNRHRSWVVRSQKTTSLLAHEQGHFDITAIGVREIHDALQYITGRSAGEVRSEAGRIIQRVQEAINETNIRYDEETDHSNIVNMQSRWETNLAAVKSNTNGVLSDLP